METTKYVVIVRPEWVFPLFAFYKLLENINFPSQLVNWKSYIDKSLILRVHRYVYYIGFLF